MADVIDVVPPAVDQLNNLKIWWVGGPIADVTAPKAATEIGAATSFPITYSLTSDGWGLAGSQEKTDDPRLTLKQKLEALGVSTTTLTLKYVDSTAAGSAAVVLTEGLSGYFVERRGSSAQTLAAAGQKGRVIAVTLGKQNPGPIDGTGKFTIVQEVAITAPVGSPVAFAA